MMLTFAVMPQTRLVTGFQSTVNLTEKPSPPSPKPINHPQLADSFTPTAVKSRAGTESPSPAEAFDAPLIAFKAIKELLEDNSILLDIKREFAYLKKIFEQEQEQKALTAAQSTKAFAEITKLKNFLEKENSPHLVEALENLKSALEQSEQAKKDLLDGLDAHTPLLYKIWNNFFKAP